MTGDQANQHMLLANTGVYNKDPKAYYGDASPQVASSGYTVTSQNNADAGRRYNKKNIYQRDPKPYYGTGLDYMRVDNYPKDKISVPIEMKELTYTFPMDNNVKTLENELTKLNQKESLNSISLSGKYMKDPNAYYDPTQVEKQNKRNLITQSINNIKEEMTRKTPFFTEETFIGQAKIQNYQNYNKENTNEIVSDSYFYNVEPSKLQIFLSFLIFLIIFLFLTLSYG